MPVNVDNTSKYFNQPVSNSNKVIDMVKAMMISRQLPFYSLTLLKFPSITLSPVPPPMICARIEVSKQNSANQEFY